MGWEKGHRELMAVFGGSVSPVQGQDVDLEGPKIVLGCLCGMGASRVYNMSLWVYIWRVAFVIECLVDGGWCCWRPSRFLAVAKR